MRVIDLFRGGAPVFSFEFFLPKAPEDMEAFISTVRELKTLEPSFVTLTYGAGGSARDRTIEAAGLIRREIGLETVSHLTCIAHSRAEIEAILGRLKALGVENIMALRGDLPKDGSAKPPSERELPHAVDLVRLIRARGGFCLGVAGYPEGHPESPSRDEDLRRLKEKADAGGDFITTQLFFDNADYFDLVRRARAAGIRQPILPGLMPVTNVGQLRRFTTMCGTRIPEAMSAELAAREADPEAVVAYGIDYLEKQCRGLLAGGAPGIHFYTLNRSRSTREVLSRLRKRGP